MLFSAGMGIGLMFYGVAEPVFHFTSPPVGKAGTSEDMKLAFFHWGMHAWGIYAVVALALAYFSFRHGLPLRISSALFQLLENFPLSQVSSLILMFVAYGMLKALRIEGVKMSSMRSTVNTAPALSGAPNAWQRRVETLVSVPKKQHVERFLTETVIPAMHSVADELKSQGLDVRTREEEDRSYLEVSHGEEIDFIYGVRMRAYAAPSFAMAGVNRNIRTEKRKQFHAEVFLREGGQGYDLMGYTKEQVIGDVLDQYEKHMYFLHAVR